MSTPSNAIGPIVDPVVRTYVEALQDERDPLVLRLADHARAAGFPLIGLESGRWLELLTRAIGGRRVFEFGSGFGFSAYFFARAVGAEGTVIGSEVDAADVQAFHALWAGHPLKARVDLRQGDAFEVFAATEGSFDAVLVDIDKHGYEAALQAAVPRLRPGGLFLADNALWGGRTARDVHDGATEALRAFNAAMHADDRLLTGILPVGDGLAVGWKRPA